MPVYSMTGFAHAETRIHDEDYAVEIKSLNHRFLEVKLRVPKSLALLESSIKQTVQAKIARGAIELRIEKKRDPLKDAALVDQRRLALQLSALRQFCSDQGLPPPTLFDVLSIGSTPMEEATVTETTDARLATEKTGIIALVEKASSALLAMREAEGGRLAQVIHQTLTSIQADLAAIERLRADWKSKVEAKVKLKVAAIMETFSSGEINGNANLETRTAQELALIWDRTDVEEEVQRLHSHFEEFKTTVSGGGSIGKKLDFLTQELGREINTLNNKSQDLGIHHIAVEMKVKLEQLREQVQNIE
jgi:uncharacterized protein (TIGR00255 family)